LYVAPLLLASFLLFGQDGRVRNLMRPRGPLFHHCSWSKKCVATYGALVLLGMISQGFRTWASLVRPAGAGT
jgi:hypothetical protein